MGIGPIGSVIRCPYSQANALRRFEPERAANRRSVCRDQCGTVTGSFIQHCDDELVSALQDVGHLGASLVSATVTFGGTGGGRGGAIDASVASDILSSATSHDFIVGPFDVCSGSVCAEAIHETFPSYVVPNLGQSVSDQQISPVYLFPDSGFSIGHVQTLFYDNGFSARNITQPDHWLCCGTVDIINWSTPSGWKVAAYGTGSNYFGVGWVNEAFGPAVFKGVLGSYISVVRARANSLGGIR